MNITKTAILLAGLTALFMALGYLIAGTTGMIFALIMAGAMNLFSWWGSDKMILSMYGAQEVDANSAPDLYNLTAELAARAGLPMPRLYLIEDPQPNAFATGRNPENAAVAVHTGLLQMLTTEEVAGVIAHELAHIRNRDTLIMTITATIAGAISMLANISMFSGNRNGNAPLGAIGGILMAILAPMAAMLVQMAISRTREYEADRAGGEICGNPLWLASGLKKIANGTAEIPSWQAQAHPATAHMFIMNPLTGSAMDNLFSTHPDPDNRIHSLIDQARQMGYGEVQSNTPASGPWGSGGAWG